MSDHDDDDVQDGVDAYPPWNFSWVVEGELAAMAWPQNDCHLRYLVRHGVGHLVTLSPEKLPPVVGFPGLQWTLIPVREFEAPPVRDILRFVDVCQRALIAGKAVAVHCRMGRGRTGVMAACYLVRFRGQAPERAVVNVRLQRPGSVETAQQERAVIRYHDCLMGTRCDEMQAIEDDTERFALV